MNNSASPIDNSADFPPETPSAPPPDGSPRSKGDLLRQQQALAVLGRRATAGPDMSNLMEDAAALLAEMLDADGSGAGHRTPDGKSLQLRLTLGDAGSLGSTTHEHQSGVGSVDSLAGFALQAARPLLVADLAQEQRFTDRYLRQHAVRSAIAVPLRVQGRPYGVLLACHRAAHAFDEGDLTFAETIAHLVAATIAQEQAEKALAEERRLIDGMLETVDAIVLVLSPQGRIVRANAACQRLTGFRLEEILDRPIWGVLCPAEEAAVFQGLRARLSPGGPPLSFESGLLTKLEGQRRIAWSCSMVKGDCGSPASIVATGVEMAEMAAFGRLPLPVNSERRIRPRRAYPYRQRIALIFKGKLPDRDRFSEVQCNDISAGGFSFLAADRPASDRVVVALGVTPRETYLIAQIAHTTQFEQDGKTMFMVGCNYIGRAVYD